MKKSALRLYGFGVPAAMAAAALFGLHELAMWITVYHLLLTAASLAAPDAFTRSAAKLISTKKVMGGLLTALLLTLLAGGGLVFAYTRVGIFTPSLVILGAILTAIRCVQELFASQGDMTSARLTDVLSFVALTAGTLIPGDTLMHCCIGAGAALGVSGLIAAGFSKREWPRPNGAIFREIPAALARTLLFPALFAGLAWLFGAKTLTIELILGYFAGQILLETAKTTFRRGKFEAAGLKTGVALAVLLFALAMLALGCFWYPVSLERITAVFMLAAACALLLYGPFDLKTLTDALIPLAAAALTALGITPAHQSFPNEVFIAPAAGTILCSLMFREWAQLYRQGKAKRIRRKARKMAGR